MNCIHCNKETKNPKYCSHSCRAKCTNRLRGNSFCQICNKKVGKRRYFCSKQCQSFSLQTESLIKFNQGQLVDRAALKRIIIKQLGYKCQRCNLSLWFNIKISLELNHIDGNAGNNLPSNLELLCPNCHSITPNWKAKNKGFGRKSRGLKLS